MACWGATLNMAGHLVSTVNLQQISLVEQLTSTHIPKEHLSQEYHYYSAKPGPGGARKWSHLTVWVPPCFTPHFPCPGPLPSFFEADQKCWECGVTTNCEFSPWAKLGWVHCASQVWAIVTPFLPPGLGAPDSHGEQDINQHWLPLLNCSAGANKGSGQWNLTNQDRQNNTPAAHFTLSLLA
jgi:hypothetical protein